MITQVFLRAMVAPGIRTFMCPPRHRAMSLCDLIFLFDLTLFSKINTCITDNDVTYIIMPRIAQESS